MTDGVPVRRRWVASAVAFAAALTITLSARQELTSAGLEPDDVVVSVDDGTAVLAEDRATTYRITVDNNTADDLDEVELTMTTPPEMTVGAAGGGSPESPNESHWRLDVEAGGTAVVELSGVVEEMAPPPAELVVTACASIADAPTVCARDVNGVERVSTATADGPFRWLSAVLAAGQFLLTAPLVVLVVAAAFLRRRRSRSNGDRGAP